jgi:L-alanine-DL-glutamate epimerase-like enolase superfamily enzyme
LAVYRRELVVKIARIETIRLSEHPRTLWVQIHTDDGMVGLGETYYVPGAVAAVIHDVAAPVLLGQSPLDIEKHWHTLFHITNYYGYAGAEMRAISAIDIALWDLAGQALGQPVYNLLGGKVRDRIRTYNTCASYGEIDDYTAFHAHAGELAQDLLGEGITAMKIWPFDQFAAMPHPQAGSSGPDLRLSRHVPQDYYTVGQHLTPEQLEQGIEPIRQIREAVGNRMEVAVELHARWNLPSAIRIARALEPYDLLWFEEALTPDPVDDLARLVQETRVPICTSERLFTRYAFRQVLERKAAHVIMPDIIWTGGISEGKKIAAMAEAYHLPIAPHDCTGPVNVFACLQLCASCPNAMIMESVRAFYRGYYGDIVTPNLEVRDGHIDIPTGHGIGTKLRPEVLARPDATIQVSGA